MKRKPTGKDKIIAELQAKILELEKRIWALECRPPQIIPVPTPWPEPLPAPAPWNPNPWVPPNPPWQPPMWWVTKTNDNTADVLSDQNRISFQSMHKETLQSVVN